MEDEIKRLHLLGYSSYKIVSELSGVSRRKVYNTIKKLGLSTNFPKNTPIKRLGNKIQCSKCLIYKDINDFIWIDKNNLRFRFCKSCKSKQYTQKVHQDYESYIKKQICQIRYRSKKHGSYFSLDAEYLIDLWKKQNGKCFYSDYDLNTMNTGGKHNVDSASLDKIIPENGYVKGNVVWCIQRVNVMKNDATIDEMKKWMPDWYNRVITCDFLNIK